MAIQQFNVGVKAAIVRDGKILIVKHATKHFWDIPGGRIDDNESTAETLARELAEELPGSKLNDIGSLVCAYRVPDFVFADGVGLVLIVYKANVDLPESLQISSEHSDIKWASYDEAVEIGSHIVKETVKALQ